MNEEDWRTQQEALIASLEARFGSSGGRPEIVDDYQVLIASIWRFTARLLGEAGTRAVLARSVQLAANDKPLLQTIHVCDDKVDFKEFREHIVQAGTNAPEVMDALLHLVVMVLQTLTELSGHAIALPLVSYLREHPK